MPSGSTKNLNITLDSIRPSAARPFVKVTISVIAEAILLLGGTLSHLHHCYSALPAVLTSAVATYDSSSTWQPGERTFSGFCGTLSKMQTPYTSLQVWMIRSLSLMPGPHLTHPQPAHHTGFLSQSQARQPPQDLCTFQSLHRDDPSLTLPWLILTISIAISPPQRCFP